MPVLPDVASRIVLEGVSFPEASPSRIMRAAARSFTEPPGFCHSAFAYSSTPGVSRSNWCSRTIGVRPIMSRTEDPGARSSTDEVLNSAIPIYDRMSPNFTNPWNPVKLTGFVQTEPDSLTRLGGWLFRHRTSLLLPVAAAILTLRVGQAPPSTALVAAGVVVTAA